MTETDLFLIATLKAWITIQVILLVVFSVDCFLVKYKIWPFN